MATVIGSFLPANPIHAPFVILSDNADRNFRFASLAALPQSAYDN